MTENEMRISIAEFCGWTVSPSGWWSDPKNPGRAHDEPPDYLHDLNAIAEAEGKLNQNQIDDYLDNLEDMGTDLDIDERWFVCHATAAQRAEALLRAVGLWKDA